MVGKTAGKITPSGMNEIAATNILGHVIFEMFAMNSFPARAFGRRPIASTPISYPLLREVIPAVVDELGEP